MSAIESAKPMFPESATELVAQVARQIDAAKYEETLGALVSIPSLSGEEGELAAWIAGRLREAGVSSVKMDEYANVVARFGSGERRLFISAHMDTMAPHPEMETPFEANVREVNGERRLYGLGSASAKSCLASIIETVRVLHNSGIEIPRTTFLAVACDLHPVRHGIKEAFAKHEFSADAVLVGEPTNGRIGVGARGYAHVDVAFEGRPHHAGRPDNSQNPIVGAAAFVQRALSEPLAEHPLLGAASLAPVEISSEGQRPQTPRRASVLIDRRLVPSDPLPDALVEQYREWAEGASPNLTVDLTLRRSQYPWEVQVEEPVVAALAESYRIVAGVEPEFAPLPFSSSAGFISHTTGMTPVAYSGGDIARMGPEEYAVLSQNVIATQAMAGMLILFSLT